MSETKTDSLDWIVRDLMPAADKGMTWHTHEELYGSLKALEYAFAARVAKRAGSFLYRAIHADGKAKSTQVGGIRMQVVKAEKGIVRAHVTGKDGIEWRCVWDSGVHWNSFAVYEPGGGLLFRGNITGKRPSVHVEPLFSTGAFRRIVRFAESLDHVDREWRAAATITNTSVYRPPFGALERMDDNMPGRNVKTTHRMLFDAVAWRVALMAGRLLRSNMDELYAGGRFWGQSHLAYSLSDGMPSRSGVVTDRLCLLARSDGGPDALLHVDTQRYIEKTPYIAWMDGSTLNIALVSAKDVTGDVEAFMEGGAPSAFRCDIETGEVKTTERFFESGVLYDFAEHCGEVRRLLATADLYVEPGNGMLYRDDFSAFTRVVEDGLSEEAAAAPKP